MVDDRARSEFTSARALVVSQSSRRGGAEGYLEALYTGLGKRGYQFDLVGSVPGWVQDTDHELRIRLGPKWSRRNILRGLLDARRERERFTPVVAAAAADWVHFQFKREQIMFTRVASEYSRVFWTEHGVFPPTMRALMPAYRRAAQRTAGIICVSVAVAESVRKIVGPRPKITIIENAVDLSKHKPQSQESRAAARQGLGLKEEDFVVLWAGRVDPSKRPNVPLELAQKYRDLKFLMAGTGSHLERIRKAAASSAPNLRLVGHRADIEIFYDAADRLLFTSRGRGEGLPTVLAESAAHGLKVVTHRGSGAESLVSALGGAIARAPHDMRGMRTALLTRDDPAERAARLEWARDHSMEAWLDAHERTFSYMGSADRPI